MKFEIGEDGSILGWVIFGLIIWALWFTVDILDSRVCWDVVEVVENVKSEYRECTPRWRY